ncbi:MAG: surface lipoprotein assembly modifier [Pseudomonadota bacterium]
MSATDITPRFTRDRLPPGLMRIVGVLLLVSFLTLLPSLAGANEQIITKAWQMVDSEQYQEAYDLLAPIESDQAGEPIYDYLLGVAALRIGQPGLALFPLERVMAVQPDYPGARMTMAEAYLAAGDIETAEREFQLAKQQDNSDPDQINRFERELNRMTIGVTAYGGTLDLALGYDDNVTSATSESTIETPNVTVNLDDDATDIDDSFTRIKGSGWVQKPLSREYKLVAAGSIVARFNASEDEQDFNALNARVGVSNRDRDNKLAGYLFTTSLDRDSEAYQDSLGFLAQWRYRLNDDAHLASYLRTAQIEYDDQDERDSLLTLLSVTYVTRIDASGSPVIYAGVNLGSNDADSSDGDEFGYSLTGLSFGVEFAAFETYRPYAYASYVTRDFDDDSSIFGETREDDRLSLRLGAEIKQLADWLITPELIYTDNDSNITINDYDRTQLMVNFRRSFK